MSNTYHLGAAGRLSAEARSRERREVAVGRMMTVDAIATGALSDTAIRQAASVRPRTLIVGSVLTFGAVDLIAIGFVCGATEHLKCS